MTDTAFRWLLVLVWLVAFASCLLILFMAA